MLIRDARSEDAVPASEVLRRSIVQLCENDHRGDPAILMRWLANKTPEHFRGWLRSSHVLVAEEDGRILGVAALTDTGHVTLNYVDPTARFRGVSRALLAAAEQRAKERGCRSCTLETTKTAERFYRAAGYVDQANDTGKRLLAKPIA